MTVTLGPLLRLAGSNELFEEAVHNALVNKGDAGTITPEAIKREIEILLKEKKNEQHPKES